MAKAAHWDAVVFCPMATVGDTATALAAFWAVAAIHRDRRWIVRPSVRSGSAFIAVGLLITVGLEWLATRVLHRWQHGSAMPNLPFLGTGALPLLQWVVLPPFLIWLVRRQILGARQARTLR